MKNDLVTSIAVAIVGILIAFFAANAIAGEIAKGKPVKTVDGSLNVEVAEPSNELFNYRAINPTVEVYIGDGTECREYDSDGQCLDDATSNDNNDNQEDE